MTKCCTFTVFLTLCIWNFLKYMFIAKELKFIKSNTHHTVSLSQQCFGIVVVSNADITFEWKYCGDFVTLNSYLLVFCRRLIFPNALVFGVSWEMIVGILRFRVRTLFWTKISRKKSFKSTSFLVLPQQEQFYPEGLSVFVGSDKVGTESPGLSSTGCNLKGLSRGLKFLF